MVHRDLKPSNILLSPRVRGSSTSASPGRRGLHAHPCRYGGRLPGFLAPEQVRGAAVTPATDVFSLGATLAYASMGDSPFGHGSSEVMLYRVVHEEAQLHGVPDALAPLVRACLAKDPEERPSTLQLSLRLKEIAAREAQGLADMRPPAPRAAEADRPTGRIADSYPERAAQRPSAGAGGPQDPQGTPPPRGGAGSRGPARSGSGTPPRGAAPSRGGGGGTRGNGAPASRSGARRTPSSRNAPRSSGGSRPGSRGGTGRPASRNTGTGRRPANPRLLRQRLVVFVVVTLLVALGIAAAQGCQGPSRGLGDDLNVVREQRQGKVRVPSDQEATEQGPSQRDDRAAVTAG
ncbi:Serine/threonine protein kinase OS=Streptomyces alboniger OX=132473 GN=CP975_05885 PE=4 SV=1 [Streptomyces alboniger]